MNHYKILISILTIFYLSGCSEISTSDPAEAYRYWAGTIPPSDLELLNGQYWQSPHWTKEYIIYLKFKPTENWWNAFLEQNRIVKDQGDWTISGDAPDWFKPSENSVRFRGNSNFDQGSRYFIDTLTGICLICEIQL